MRNYFCLIINLTFISLYCQKLDYIDTNDKTINKYLTYSEGFTIKDTRTEDGYRIFSSIKKTENSYFIDEVYFINEYPIHHVFSLYQRFDKNDELVKELKDDITKAIYNDEIKYIKERGFEFDKISDDEYSTRKINTNGIWYVEKGKKGENNEYYLFNREKYEALDISPFKKPNSENYISELFKVSTYNIEDMIVFFIKDLKKELNEYAITNKAKIDSKKVFFLETNLDKLLIKATFEEMDESKLAVSYGINNDKNVIVKVNPLSWSEASNQKKWYIIYHELGHDILNFNHGEGDKMMFNFVDKKYSWQDFYEDRKKMFDIYFNKKLKAK
jgi:hypothetical protein